MSQMKFYGKRLCFIGAHPDDIEIGAGALISHIRDKAEVLCVTLSDNQMNPDLPNLPQEHYNSMARLGVKPEQVRLMGFHTRNFPHQRQEILEEMVKIQKEYQPDIVFVHSGKDVHQDHHTVTTEALRAFRGRTVLGFDVIRSSYGFFPDFLVEINEDDVNAKIAALAEYKTYSGRYYFDADLTRSILVRYGAICERKYAEGFDILRIVAEFGM